MPSSGPGRLGPGREGRLRLVLPPFVPAPMEGPPRSLAGSVDLLAFGLRPPALPGRSGVRRGDASRLGTAPDHPASFPGPARKPVARIDRSATPR